MNIKRMICYQIFLKALGKKDVRGFCTKLYYAGANSFRFQRNKNTLCGSQTLSEITEN
jgi:hypothetical protein